MVSIESITLEANDTDTMDLDLTELKASIEKDLAYNISVRHNSSSGAYTYIIQASADNVNWSPLANGANPIGVSQALNPFEFVRIQFTDTSGVANSISVVVRPFCS